MNASRLVAGALQSRDLQEYLTNYFGAHVLTAHETLSLPYEIPFVRTDPETGKQYLHSAHLPWIGLRTNGLGGVHLDLLAGVENTAGVKIGANSDERHIAGLARKLNPEGIPGKIAFMIRIGEKDEEQLRPILGAIRNYAPESAVLYDIHGATKTSVGGNKIRLRDDIVGSIERLAYACGNVGLRLNGLHLETMNVQGRFECLNNMSQNLMEGSVDPRLNPKQTKFILDKTVQFINQ